MKYVTSILSSFKERDSYKSFSLQQRLVLFFSLISGCVILTFTLLLVIFDLTGINKKTIYRFMENELSHIMETAQRDFGNISSLGIRLSEYLSASCEDYLTEMGLTAGRLLTSREHMEDFLNSSASSMILLAKQNDCGGIFVILDSQLTDTSADDYGKSGLFFKRTQPLSSPAVSPKLYYLRGAASIAREHKIELLGQWQMYYRKEELNFFDKVMETSKENNDLPLSKLFYWSQRVLLDGNSEEGLLLCLPIILDDGSLLGVCGLEVSDRMFKQSYSPDESVYPGVFSLLSPRIENEFYAPGGLVAGNRYLTGGYVSSPLISSLEVIRTKGDFSIFQGHTGDYGGLTGDFMLYPAGSPYEDEMWALSILMPDSLFSAETVADTLHLFLIVFSLLILSVLACFILSRRFLRPIEKGLSSISEMQFESEKGEFGISENEILCGQKRS